MWLRLADVCVCVCVLLTELYVCFCKSLVRMIFSGVYKVVRKKVRKRSSPLLTTSCIIRSSKFPIVCANYYNFPIRFRYLYNDVSPYTKEKTRIVSQ